MSFIAYFEVHPTFLWCSCMIARNYKYYYYYWKHYWMDFCLRSLVIIVYVFFSSTARKSCD